ncbi:sugar phosphate isomerase/epimerase [Lacihabitans sp. LS3-19]|uniref:sugar phosphate isomerase/epimerase family protein n=1 Tax=Lacihabitans sp. LS3-19 TaxID=2487335 RepID=UPI0020CFE76F|nr:sugar phosphate isomerase/epimerase [Lacihabitans sp. LS3-19]MCP9769612.1 sugar phosphate isomerase/epimerase [Lacihabitans sp. LS3-19]
MKRRNFLAGLPAFSLLQKFEGSKIPFPISSNSYNWGTFYDREGKNWGANLEADMAEYAKTGLQAYEPSLSNANEARKLIEVLKKFKIKMPSVYIGSVLHEEKEIQKSVKNIQEIAEVVKRYGTKIIVTNPNPINWGSDKLKSDEQLILQAKTLDKIGKSLKLDGIKLAYHTHDVELKAGAREFHHMLQNTSPENLFFCMDVHWIYRGSQNSQLAVFDVIKMYGNRIVELHIRQSRGYVWQEIFSPDADINYNQVVRELLNKKVKPHLVIEQCLEKGSPNTMNAVAAHKMDLKEVQNTFKLLLQP